MTFQNSHLIPENNLKKHLFKNQFNNKLNNNNNLKLLNNNKFKKVRVEIEYL